MPFRKRDALTLSVLKSSCCQRATPLDKFIRSRKVLDVVNGVRARTSQNSVPHGEKRAIIVVNKTTMPHVAPKSRLEMEIEVNKEVKIIIAKIIKIHQIVVVPENEEVDPDTETVVVTTTAKEESTTLTKKQIKSSNNNLEVLLQKQLLVN